MIINKELILLALKKVRLEKLIQGKILDAINNGNYELANYLVESYKKTVESTNESCLKILENVSEDSFMCLNELIEDFAMEKYGGNTSEGQSLNSILTHVYLNKKTSGGIIDSDTFLEELSMYIHSLAVEKYLNSPKGKYKDEMLDHINNNISRSISLRYLFTGNKEKYDEYNPDLYYNFLDAKLAGEDMIKMLYFTTCISLDEINRAGTAPFDNMDFTDEEKLDIIKAQKDLEKIKLASYYMQSIKRFFDIRIDLKDFSEDTKKEIEEGFTIGDKILRREGIIRDKKKTNS